jgi:hypothetical protein
MAYNEVYVFVAFDVLAAAQLNNNDANLDFLKTQVDVRICNGRLTLETGVAVSTTNQTAKTTVYFTPYDGNKIGLYDGTATTWDLYTFTEKSLSLSGLIKGVLYDIYGYLSAGTLALESLAWKKVTASNSPTAGANKVINLSDTAGLAVGMEVSVKDGSNSEVTNITAVVASTSITVDNLAASYTTPDVYGYPTRATDITLNSGIYIKSGDTTRRYLGTIRITTSTGQCEDSTLRRNVWNMYNRVERILFCQDTTASWSYTTAAFRSSNANTSYGTGRFGLVIGLSELPIEAEFSQTIEGATAVAQCSIALDTPSTSGAPKVGVSLTTTGQRAEVSAWLYTTLGIGAHYLQRIEFGGTGAVFYGGSGQSTMIGLLEM